MKLLKHKGYVGSIEFDLEDQCLHGRVLFINDVVSYGGDTVEQIQESFKGAVDSYLAMCEENGVSPDQPFSGTFNVRIGPVLHRNCAVLAAQTSKTINQVVVDAVTEYLEQKSESGRMLQRLKSVQFAVIQKDATTSNILSSAQFSNHNHLNQGVYEALPN